MTPSTSTGDDDPSPFWLDRNAIDAGSSQPVPFRPEPLRIGAAVVWPPVVLAPMAGVTNAPFRTLCRRFGGERAPVGAGDEPGGDQPGGDQPGGDQPGGDQPGAGRGNQPGGGLFVNEMVMAKALVEGNERTEAMVRFAPDETFRSLQLYGTNPVDVGEAARRLAAEDRIDHLDLNFGCPAAKVTRKGGGAAVPVHRPLLRSIVAAAVAATEPYGIPVTVKFRKGIDDDHLTYLDTGRIAEEAGAVAVALHARTAEQHYSGAADWDAIARLKQHVTSIPVLGNGDILDGGDALDMMRETGCDGVVVGRGCLGRPWLFGDLVAAFEGRPASPSPSLAEVIAVMVEHAGLLVEFFGPGRGPREMRKHVGWYLKGFPVGPERRRLLASMESLDDLGRLTGDVLANLDGAMRLSPADARIIRGHTSGPRKVVLPDGWLESVDDDRAPEVLGLGAEEVVSGG